MVNGWVSKGNNVTYGDYLENLLTRASVLIRELLNSLFWVMHN
jgi:hypothetical protein